MHEEPGENTVKIGHFLELTAVFEESLACQRQVRTGKQCNGFHPFSMKPIAGMHPRESLYFLRATGLRHSRDTVRATCEKRIRSRCVAVRTRFILRPSPDRFPRRRFDDDYREPVIFLPICRFRLRACSFRSGQAEDPFPGASSRPSGRQCSWGWGWWPCPTCRTGMMARSGLPRPRLTGPRRFAVAVRGAGFGRCHARKARRRPASGLRVR